MPRIVRNADVTWSGNVARGEGKISGGSGAMELLPFTLATRIGKPEGKTSPEELVAAAHASCFVTSLGSELARAGTPPERMRVHCTITMDEVEGGHHRIVSSHVAASALVPNSDDATFRQAVDAADAGCPISALIRGTATVTVEAKLEGGSDG